MDTPQDIGLVKPMEELVSTSTSNNNTNYNKMVVGSMGGMMRSQQPISAERRALPQKEQALNCPRCNSANTKFCYYNNYSLTQPRYFCKTCRRYWTEGGSLRNVPVGGGSRKNKRSSSSSIATGSATAATSISLSASSISAPASSSKNQNPKFQEGQDLNLAFTLPSLELLRSTAGIQGRGINPFMPVHPVPMPPEYPSSSVFTDFRSNSSLSFPLDHIDGGINGGLQEGSGRLMFPFDESARVVSSGGDQSGGDPPGFWNGMMGGGGGSW